MTRQEALALAWDIEHADSHLNTKPVLIEDEDTGRRTWGVATLDTVGGYHHELTKRSEWDYYRKALGV